MVYVTDQEVEALNLMPNLQYVVNMRSYHGGVSSLVSSECSGELQLEDLPVAFRDSAELCVLLLGSV